MSADATKFRHADQSKTLGYIVVYTDGDLASSRVFGTKKRAEKFRDSIHPTTSYIHKVREETEREAHKWG